MGSEKILSCAVSFSLNQVMSLVIRTVNCLSHQISSTLSSFCEGEPLEREVEGRMGEFQDGLLLWDVLESLGIYKKVEGGTFKVEVW